MNVLLIAAILFALWGLIFKVDWYWGDRFAEAVRDDMLDRYEKGELDLRSDEQRTRDELINNMLTNYHKHKN